MDFSEIVIEVIDAQKKNTMYFFHLFNSANICKNSMKTGIKNGIDAIPFSDIIVLNFLVKQLWIVALLDIVEPNFNYKFHKIKHSKQTKICKIVL